MLRHGICVDTEICDMLHYGTSVDIERCYMSRYVNCVHTHMLHVMGFVLNYTHVTLHVTLWNIC